MIKLGFRYIETKKWLEIEHFTRVGTQNHGLESEPVTPLKILKHSNDFHF